MENYIPLLTSALIVPGLMWLKNKIKKDVPILWLLLSIGTSIGASWGAGEALGIDPAAVDLNTTLAPALTLLLHSVKKSIDKSKLPVEVKPE